MAVPAGADLSGFDPNDAALWESEGDRREALEWGWDGTADMQRVIGRRWNGVFDHLRDNNFAGVREPFRLRVQKMLTVAIRQITPQNGFFCDLSDERRVRRGRAVFDSGSPLPLVSILEEPFAFDEDLPAGEGIVPLEPYELIVQGWIEEGDNPTDPAHYLLSDLKRRFSALKLDENERRARIFRIGNKQNVVVSIQWDGGVVRPTEDRTGVAQCWLRVAFEMAQDYRNPTA